MKKKIKKKFDCIEAKRLAQLRIYEEIKNMTMEQELIYWKKVREEFQSKYGRKYSDIVNH